MSKFSRSINVNDADLSRIIEMAWEDRTPFEAIYNTYYLSEAQVINLMREHLQRKAFKDWRPRVSNRKFKHLKLRSTAITSGYCSTQYKLKNR